VGRRLRRRLGGRIGPAVPDRGEPGVHRGQVLGGRAEGVLRGGPAARVSQGGAAPRSTRGLPPPSWPGSPFRGKEKNDERAQPRNAQEFFGAPGMTREVAAESVPVEGPRRPGGLTMADSNELADLVRRLRAGDPQAAEELVRRYEP